MTNFASDANGTTCGRCFWKNLEFIFTLVGEPLTFEIQWHPRSLNFQGLWSTLGISPVVCLATTACLTWPRPWWRIATSSKTVKRCTSRCAIWDDFIFGGLGLRIPIHEATCKTILDIQCSISHTLWTRLQTSGKGVSIFWSFAQWVSDGFSLVLAHSWPRLLGQCTAVRMLFDMILWHFMHDMPDYTSTISWVPFTEQRRQSRTHYTSTIHVWFHAPEDVDCSFDCFLAGGRAKIHRTTAFQLVRTRRTTRSTLPNWSNWEILEVNHHMFHPEF